MCIERVSRISKPSCGNGAPAQAYRHHGRQRGPDGIKNPANPPNVPKPPIQRMPPVEVPPGERGVLKPLPLPLPILPVGDDAEPGVRSVPVDPDLYPMDPISLDQLA